MLDLTFIRQNSEKIRHNNKIRKCQVSVDEILELDKQKRQMAQGLDQMRSRRNQVSEARNDKPSDIQIQEMQKLKESIKYQILSIKEIEDQLNALLLQLPNLTDESVPVGKDETGNQVYKKWSPDDPKEGIIKEPLFTIKPHWEIGKELDLIDEEKGAKIAGSRFWYLKNELVYLEFGIIQYALNYLKSEKFTPVLPPMIVRERAMYGTGFFPADENEIYRLANPEIIESREMSNDKIQMTNQIQNPNVKSQACQIPTWDEANQYLIGTAEVPLAAYHSDEVIDLKKPKKYCGFSSCFRREAGAYGKDLKGILRGHQFDKIEMFIFCKEEDSWAMHEYLQEIAEKFWQSLGIPYQTVLMCSGDIGAPNAKKYDIEAWMPGQGRYREVGSCSNDTDFQARRLNIKYKNTQGQKQYAHTLNNTLCALGRTMIAICENYQTEKGSIEIPEALKPYMFGIKEISRKSS
ncbi:MAG: serine--tRNA ligase [Patescibacteria group bacterium]